MKKLRQWIKTERELCQKYIEELSLPSCLDSDKEMKIYGWKSRMVQLQDLSAFLNDQEIDMR